MQRQSHTGAEPWEILCERYHELKHCERPDSRQIQQKFRWKEETSASAIQKTEF